MFSLFTSRTSKTHSSWSLSLTTDFDKLAGLHNLSYAQEDFDKLLIAIGRAPEGELAGDQVEEKIKIIGKIHEML